MKPTTAILKITNCLDCPHHKNTQSPSTGDSFDMVDEDTVCTKARGGYDRNGVKGRAITTHNRPWESRREASVPSWCPLLKEKK